MFKTGKPLLLKWTHRKQKTGNFGSRYGQDIEPSGLYVVHGHWGTPGIRNENGSPVETIHGETRLSNPLVLEHGGYGSDGWKAFLYSELEKKGKALTKELVRQGFDAIVTVDKHGTSEIVLLEPQDLSKKPQPEVTK